MTRNEIIQMARQAGMAGLLTDIVTTVGELESFAALVEAACMPMKRKPLTDEHLQVLIDAAPAYDHWGRLDKCGDVNLHTLARSIEAAHGITTKQGGQHGTE